jgi:thioredoxin 1
MNLKSRQSSLKLAVTASVAMALTVGTLAGVFAAAPKAAAPSPLANVKSLLAKNDNNKAIMEIEKYLATNPQSAEGNLLAGEANFKAGNFKKASKCLRAAVRLGKGSPNSVKANAFLLKLPKDLQSPRTGPDTRLLASMFGLSRLRGDGDTPKPTVIDFYASWCQPCRDMDKALEKAQKTYGGKLNIMKVDIDDPKNDKIVDQYEVSPIPTVVFLNTDGEVVTYTIGYAENNVTDGLKKIMN